MPRTTRACERPNCSSSSAPAEANAQHGAEVSYHAARCVAKRRPRSGVAQWQSERLLIVRLWVRVPPPELLRAPFPSASRWEPRTETQPGIGEQRSGSSGFPSVRRGTGSAGDPGALTERLRSGGALDRCATEWLMADRPNRLARLSFRVPFQ